jgi:PAS domain S-box-containing protein
VPEGGRELAGWLLARRRAIEAAASERLGAAPGADSAEAEALRRFRSFVLLALGQGATTAPSLEGVRTREARMRRWLEAWVEAATEAAGPEAERVRAQLGPLRDRFLQALRETAGARRASGAPRASKRRAVAAAIDRVCDAFLAIDADTGAIADANPAAGALLGTTRDRLLGSDAMDYVPTEARELWWAHLDAMSEGSEPRRFRGALQSADGHALPVEATITRFATRSRTLALIIARP